MPPYTLRPATAADYAFLRALHRATMRDYVDQTWGWDEASQAARFEETFDPARQQIIVAAGEDIGVLIVERRPDALFLAEIAIHPTRQGRGLGTAVIADILADARRHGLPVALQVLRVNPARRLYERLGFAITGETATHHLMRAPADRKEATAMPTTPSFALREPAERNAEPTPLPPPEEAPFDVVEQAGIESFPASDAPAWNERDPRDGRR